MRFARALWRAPCIFIDEDSFKPRCRFWQLLARAVDDLGVADMCNGLYAWIFPAVCGVPRVCDLPCWHKWQRKQRRIRHNLPCGKKRRLVVRQRCAGWRDQGGRTGADRRQSRPISLCAPVNWRAGRGPLNAGWKRFRPRPPAFKFSTAIIPHIPHATPRGRCQMPGNSNHVIHNPRNACGTLGSNS